MRKKRTRTDYLLIFKVDLYHEKNKSKDSKNLAIFEYSVEEACRWLVSYFMRRDQRCLSIRRLDPETLSEKTLANIPVIPHIPGSRHK